MNLFARHKIISIVLIGALGLIVFGMVSGARSSEQSNSEQLIAKPISEDVSTAEPTRSPLVIGDPNAPITIIEYSDFKCPECNKHYQDAGSRIRKEYIDTGKVNLIFRPYPLFSEDGAKALAGSYCANLQGKFPEYYDTMFSYMWDNHYKQGDFAMAIEPVFTDSVVADLIQKIGMDAQEYAACLETEETRTAYDDDLMLSGPDNVQGTPTLIVGDQKVVGSQPYNVYKTLLDIELR